jgi:hypothetical protein
MVRGVFTESSSSYECVRHKKFHSHIYIHTCCIYVYRLDRKYVITLSIKVAFPDKLIVSQLVKKYTAIYGAQRSVAAFTRVHRWIPV